MGQTRAAPRAWRSREAIPGKRGLLGGLGVGEDGGPAAAQARFELLASDKTSDLHTDADKKVCTGKIRSKRQSGKLYTKEEEKRLGNNGKEIDGNSPVKGLYRVAESFVDEQISLGRPSPGRTMYMLVFCCARCGPGRGANSLWCRGTCSL